MSLLSRLASALKAQDPAPSWQERAEKRLEELEEAVGELAEQNEGVLEKLRSWSAREAAKKRHEASRNLDELMAGEHQGGGENVDPGAPQGEELALKRLQAERMAAKRAVFQRIRGGG